MNTPSTILDRNVGMLDDTILVTFTPNENFKNIFKSSYATKGISPKKIDEQLSIEALENHSVVFASPIFHTLKEWNNILESKKDTVFDSLFDVWVWDKTQWPKARNISSLPELFDISVLPTLIDLFNIREQKGKFSVLALKSNQPVLSWFQNKVPQGKGADLEQIEQIKLAILMPQFTQEQELYAFLEKHFNEIFEFSLLRFTNDPTLWPKNRSIDNFLEWFECRYYLNFIDIH
ncbi:MAG: hypothetical protein JSS07_08410 [Proteobacteria bacterium]|nr:hypothetical protein [Pseudomonadota bacterium]